MRKTSGRHSAYTPGLAQRQGGTDRFVHSDWVGSRRYLSDSTGNSFPSMLLYDAFGGRSAAGGTDGASPSPFEFAGDFGYQTEYASATEPGLGLQYLQDRYYDPSFGRFDTPDPVGVAGGLNLCGYGGNDPLNAADPSGDHPLLVAAAVVGMLLALEDAQNQPREVVMGVMAEKISRWPAASSSAKNRAYSR